MDPIELLEAAGGLVGALLATLLALAAAIARAGRWLRGQAKTIDDDTREALRAELRRMVGPALGDSEVAEVERPRTGSFARVVGAEIEDRLSPMQDELHEMRMKVEENGRSVDRLTRQTARLSERVEVLSSATAHVKARQDEHSSARAKALSQRAEMKALAEAT